MNWGGILAQMISTLFSLHTLSVIIVIILVRVEHVQVFEHPSESVVASLTLSENEMWYVDLSFCELFSYRVNKSVPHNGWN